MSVTDTELFALAKNGDQCSLGILLERYRPFLYARALYILGYGTSAEDAVQDALVIAITRLNDVRNPEAIGSWLYKIVSNVCFMQLRRQREIPFSTLGTEKHFYNPHGQDMAEEYLDRLLMKDLVWRSIETLSDSLKVTLLLRYYSAYHSYQEIATILAIPLGTVRSRLSEAKKKIALQLKTSSQEACGEKIPDNVFTRENIRELWIGMWAGNLDLLPVLFHQNLEFDWAMPDSIVPNFGRAAWYDELVGDNEAGTVFHPDRTMATNNIAIVEGRVENSPQFPFRCPPGASAIIFHDGSQIQRMRFYLAPQPQNPP